ncbi:MAG: outer membrane protein assembly factor BamE [Gammaproteobacteria bacterium]|nr:outer membrane protein assembly factor BamE [Gammaproteobacteria bacterium]MCW5583477.1 outer membrane protein assembly factor BamE [Gammaproteobacteria bacterium]
MLSHKNLLRLLLTTCLCLLILACSKLTQENFDKIKPEMTMQEVIAILGEPTSAESINIAGISGTSAVWKDNYAEIDIQFLNDKVTVKAFSKTGDRSSNNRTTQDNKK